MHIEQKQNKIFKPQSIYTLAAEESNQVTTEIENQITAGGLTPSSSSLTQLRDSIKNVVDTAANNLQSQIDAITASSDVFDVVGTYADLQAYDKSTVPLNDIIKVLQDSTHNNAATYYRLVDASGGTEWQYIGQEGPYYTKSEIDTDFALKSELPSIATTQQVGLIKPDGQSTFVGNDGTLTISSNVAAALPLFTPVWADHKLNDASYLLADTFSWQSGAVYTNGYNHLVADIAGVTATTETIAGTTITYYQATDGHKIVLADQENNVSTIYTATGVAWYYILDTDNTRFKLPRTKFAFTGLRDTVGKYVAESLPNIKGEVQANRALQNDYAEGAFYLDGTIRSDRSTNNTDQAIIKFDASRSSSVYADDAPVQQRATQMYLYFYVGQFTQSATEQTAGLNSSLFNGKVDLNLSNINPSNTAKSYFANIGMPSNTTYDTLTLGSSGDTYQAPADGYFLLYAEYGSGNNASYDMYVNGTALGNRHYFAANTVYSAGRCLTPVAKGQSITVNYNGVLANIDFKFIYAVGSEWEKQ